MVEPRALVAILLMAMATYATRAGGLWLAGRFDLSGRWKAWLSYLPGAVLVSLAAPVLASGGAANVLAAVAVVLVAARTGSLLAAMIAGVGSVILLRAVLSLAEASLTTWLAQL